MVHAWCSGFCLCPGGAPGWSGALTMGCCAAECSTDPQYHKPQAVGFVGAVAVSVSQEGINTADSAAEQLQCLGLPYPLARP